MRGGAFVLVSLFPALLHGQAADPLLTEARAVVDALSAPAMHGRGYVQGGDSLAAAYIAARFRAVGIRPFKASYFQPFSFPVNTFPDSIGVSLDGRTLRPGVDYLVDPASGRSVGEFDVVHLSLQDLLDPQRRAMAMGVVAGKAIALHLPATTQADSLALFRALRLDLMHHGPVLVKAPGKLTWGVSQEQLPNALVEVAAEAWNDTVRTLAIDVRNHHRRHQARNVWGLAKGRSSKRTIVVTAHYDHLGRMGPDALFPGANDNASGVAMLLALAQRFAQRPARYDVLFIAFAGEEAGLVGSEWCVVDRKLDLGTVRMLINLDLLGTGEEGLMVVNATEQRAAYDQLVAINARTGRLPQVKARGPACNSDHCPFVRKGVPALFLYTLGGVAHYHDVFDRADTLPLTRFTDIYALLVDFILGLK